MDALDQDPNNSLKLLHSFIDLSSDRGGCAVVEKCASPNIKNENICSDLTVSWNTLASS